MEGGREVIALPIQTLGSGPMIPTVDVVVPCYRYGRFLRECVSSVLTQDDVEVRILIIDDASSDGSADVANELASEDGRVEVIVHRANQGHIATYNEGIEWASAKYFLLLSADDLITPGCLKRAVSIMEQHASISMTHGDEIDLLPNREAPDLAQQGCDGQWIVQPGLELIKGLCHSATNSIRTSTVVVRTAAQKAVGGYRQGLPHAGDLEMWLRLASIGKVAKTPLIQGIRRVHRANMSMTEFGHPIADFRQLMAAFDTFFRKEGQRLDNCKELWGLSRSCLAERFLWKGVDELWNSGPLRGFGVIAAVLWYSPSIILSKSTSLRVAKALIASSALRARRSLARMVSAVLVQTKGLRSALWRSR
jgi:glycosyltransferase involved in cell wall biosynthesis